MIINNRREKKAVLSFSIDMQTSITVKSCRNITGNEKEFIRLNVSRNINISASRIIDIVNCSLYNNKISILLLI